MKKVHVTPLILAGVSAVFGSCAAMYYAGDFPISGHHPVFGAVMVAWAIFVGLMSLYYAIQGPDED